MIFKYATKSNMIAPEHSVYSYDNIYDSAIIFWIVVTSRYKSCRRSSKRLLHLRNPLTLGPLLITVILSNYTVRGKAPGYP